MRIHDRAFTGSTSYLATAKHLQTVTGKNISLFSEFMPTCFPHREYLYLLMRAFLVAGNCFFFSGTFVAHVAGILNGYRGICLCITLTDTQFVGYFKELTPRLSNMRDSRFTFNTQLWKMIFSFTKFPRILLP